MLDFDDATKLAAQGRLKEGAGLEHPPLYYSLASFVGSLVNATPVVCTAADGLRATVLGILAHAAVSHVRFNIFPEGGVSRLRLFGRIS